ncbi:IS4 family transposase, partial [Frankia sp. CiP3]|uniref:IS4 family transposase n=1 Tax=Frankia sp. CiP3 TaxID=2880971 RepID=UPI001EF4C80E
VLAETGKVQKRVRDLPARVGVYLLLAGVLHADTGWPGVWRELVAGLKGLPVARPSASSMAASRRRLGVAPFRALFEALRGAAAAGRVGSVFWHGRLVCAIDGTSVGVPDTDENKTVYRKGGSNHGGTGYPLVRLVALVACGTRSVIDAVFGPTTSGESTYAVKLLPSLHARMILLADRGFAGEKLLGLIAGTGADFLVRVTNNRLLPVLECYPDGSWRSRVALDVRVIRCEITVVTDAGRKTGYYLLVTTVLDPAVPATDLIRLYHDRWLIE